MTEGLTSKELQTFIELVAKANDSQLIEMGLYIVGNGRDRVVAQEAEALQCK